MSAHTGQHVIEAARRASVEHGNDARWRLERAERAGRDALVNAAVVAAPSAVAAFASRRIAAEERDFVAKLREALPQGGHLSSVIEAGPSRMLVPRSRLTITGGPRGSLGTMERRTRHSSNALRSGAEVTDGGVAERADEAANLLPGRLGCEHWSDKLETLSDIARQMTGPRALERILQLLDTEERRLQTPG